MYVKIALASEFTPPYRTGWGTMVVRVRPFSLKYVPADGEARGQYAMGTARDPCGAATLPTTLSNPLRWRWRWVIRWWQRGGHRRKLRPQSSTSTSTARALGVGTASLARKRDEGGQIRCQQRIPCHRLSIQAESWHISIQVKIWWMFPGSGGNSPHRGDASLTATPEDEQSRYRRGRAPQFGRCCCLSLG